MLFVSLLGGEAFLYLLALQGKLPKVFTFPPRQLVTGSVPMVAALWARILTIALDFAIVGAFIDIGWQLHHKQVHGAISHTMIASICIIALAVAAHVANKLIGKNPSGLHLAVSCELTKEKPRAKTQKYAKKVTHKRKTAIRQ